MNINNLYFQIPNTPEKWALVAKSFQEKWNFPNCIGALDGKHITIRKPNNTGSQFFNYKKFFSIVLLGLVDADYKFLFVDIGCNGRVSDGSVFENSGLAEALRCNKLNIPADTPIEGIEGDMPFCIVADEAFPLKTYIMKPYAKKNLSFKKRVFNYRCSRARRIVENAFGILVHRFQILQRPILLQPGKAKQILYCCVVLHNFLREICDNSNCLTEKFDLTVMPDLIPNRTRIHTAKEAEAVRDKLATYFCTSGAVSWQWDKVQ